MSIDKENLEKKYALKEIYTEDEKKIILDRLDKERRILQNYTQNENVEKASYSEEDKYKILNKLNQDRISIQNREEIKKRRLENKEVYTFGSKRFYKFLNMEREYFIEIEDCEKFSRRPAIIPLYYRTFEELNKKDFLIKTEVYSDKIFISHDAIRVYFKAYSLEEKRKI